MKQKILEALKAKFVGVNEQVLDRIAEKAAKTITTEDGVNTAVDGVTFQQVLDSYGDSRATEAQKTAVANYEKKHGIKDGKPVNQGSQEDNKNNQNQGGEESETAKMLKQLLEQNQKLTERLDGYDRDRTTTSRKQQLSTVLEKLPESLRKAYERTAIDTLSDEEFTTTLNDITTEVNGLVSDMNQRGVVFSPAQGGNQQNGQELTKEQKERINHRDGNTSDEAQPF